MRPFRLNLSTMRDTSVRAVLDPVAATEAGLPRPITRTHGPGPVDSSETRQAPPFDVVDTGRQVAFWVGGRECWLIDPRRFGGAPQLKVERGERTLRIALSDAFYPGTSFSADFVGELREEDSVWWMRIRLALGDFQAEFPFVSWLCGLQTACAPVTLIPPPLPLGTRAGLVVRGKAVAEFTPRWTFTIRGDKLARFVGIGNSLVANTLSIVLLDRRAPSLFSHPADRRSAMDLSGLQGAWPLDLKETARDGWAFLSDGCPFDTVRVEASEPRDGAIVRALRAETTNAEPKLFGQPVDRGAAWDGLELKLALVQPRFAVAFNPKGNETALYADYANPSWRTSSASRQRIDLDSATGRLELLIQGSEVTWLTRPPALPNLRRPLVSAVADPAPALSAGRLAVVSDAESASRLTIASQDSLSAG